MKTSTRRAHSAFTLVELLVVIGIIAVLVGILLPALNAARRQAAAAKCLSNMRQIGAAFNLYAVDNKGVWPCCVWRDSDRTKDYWFDTDYTSYAGNPGGAGGPAVRNWYWHQFIQKYANNRAARDVATASDRGNVAQNNILWGCPNWDPWITSAFTGGFDADQNGYGMNWCPTYREDFPSTAKPDTTNGIAQDAVDLTQQPAWSNRAYRQTSGANRPGRFFKQVEWKQPSERGLICDSEYFAPALDLPPQADGFPTPQAAHIYQNYGDYNLDFFRHGKPGKPTKTPQGGPGLDTHGAKVGINMLFCDGHAATLTQYSDVYMALRRKYK